MKVVKVMLGLYLEFSMESVEYGWGPPLILDTQGRSIGELKPKKE